MNSIRLSIHGVMLADHARNDALRRAIEAAVKPGDVVIDVGAGTGFLSLVAARAGAARVYAIECTPLARVAQRIVDLNGYSGTIEIVESDSRDWTPPEQADVVISETLGFAALDEGFRDVARDACRRYLAPAGVFLPRSVDLFAAPVERPPTVLDWGELTTLAGFDLTPMHRLLMQSYQRAHIPRALELAPAERLWRVRADSTDEGILSAEPEFSIVRPGLLAGVAMWFEADLGAGIVMSSRDDDPRNHWGQTFLPAAAPLPVARHDRVRVAVRLEDRRRSFGLSWNVAVETPAPEVVA